MLTPGEEHELRNRSADLVMSWHVETRGSTDAAGENGYRTLIEAAAIVADEANRSLGQWISASRRAGLTWADVGDTLGISRQAAQQRFGGSDPAAPAPQEDGLIVRKGVTAFNEVEVLREEGLAGREVVGATWLTLYFRQTDRFWEHQRLVSLRRGRPIEAMEADGWTHAFSWYPYLYFKRPLES